MSKELTKSARSVQEAIERAELTYKVLQLPSSARTALDAAASIGCDISQIVKSLIFKTKHTAQPILILTSGSNRVDEKQIESHIGENVVKADADFTRSITGFAIGGIPPIGHKTHIEFVFIDEDLLKHEEIWAAAGTPHAVFCMKSRDLVSLTHGKVISLESPLRKP